MLVDSVVKVRSTVKLFCWALVFVLLPSLAFAQPARAPRKERAAAGHRRLDVRVHRLTAISHMIRKYSTSKAEPPKGIEGFGAAVGLARQLSSEFGGWDSPAWSAIEIALTKYQTASDALAAPARLPSTVTSRKGTVIPVREAAVR